MYVMKKVGAPLTNITELCMSPKSDMFLVVKMKNHTRDLVLDMGTQGPERLSEIVAVLCHIVEDLTGSPLKVTFADRLTFNNSREEEDGKEGPGVDVNLDFLPHPKPSSLKGCGTLSKSKTG